MTSRESTYVDEQAPLLANSPPREPGGDQGGGEASSVANGSVVENTDTKTTQEGPSVSTVISFLLIGS